MALLKQSTAYTRLFKMISSSDHLSLKTAAAPVVNLSKAGAAFGAAGGAVTEIANGWYKVALNTTDTGTLGDLAYYITGTGADDTDFLDQVSTLIDADLATPTNITAGTITTVSGNVNGSVGSVTGAVGSVTGAVGSVTASVTLPAIPTNWITATGINAAALNGKGDWNTTTPPTAAAIATGVWQDAVAGDFTTAGSIGKSLGGAFSALGTSVYTAPALANAPSGTGASAATIATAVWQDAVAGDFTAASSIGKSLYNAFTVAGGSVYSSAALANAPSGGLTGAQIATAVWTDTTAADFTTALSVGKSVMNGVSLGTGLTINGYTGNTAQTGDSFARIGAAGAGLTGITGVTLAATQTGVTIPTVTTVGSVTGLTASNLDATISSVKALLPSALTGAGNMKTDVLALNGDATSAANIAFTTKVIGRGTASGVPTTTSIPTSAMTPAGAAADQFKGRIITFDATTTTTALRAQSTDITASSNASTPTFTVTALTTAPTSGDTFSIT